MTPRWQVCIIIVTERQREMDLKYGPPSRTITVGAPAVAPRAARSTSNFHRPLNHTQRYSDNVGDVSTPLKIDEF
jgi:hypothetical protein